ncbi:MAG: hypothetical protein KDD73_02535 [Anaerolineales bacterium]|nr:hypothetical protein [Anaerolineales bacterium]MCB9128227.1 hypothetical protein [Ardenticatenales bacterium]
MKFNIRRPTIDTPFHIDWGWFERNRLSAESAVYNQVCESHRAEVEPAGTDEMDYIDSTTGEVFVTDARREVIMALCQFEDDYISAEMPLHQAVFRLLLASNNRPTSPAEMAAQLNRHDPQTLLRLLTSGSVSYGVIPLH